MKPIEKIDVQKEIEEFFNKKSYLHLETTSGAYTGYRNKTHTTGAYIRNAEVTPSEGKITGNGPFRVGLKIELGWVYAEGLTHWIVNENNQLLLAGLDDNGKLAVALQLSPVPFVN